MMSVKAMTIEELENVWNCIAKVWAVDADNIQEVHEALDNGHIQQFERQDFIEAVVDYRKLKAQICPEEALEINLESLQDYITKSGIHHHYRFTEVGKEDGIQEHQAGVIAVKDGKVYRSFVATIHSISDRGEYFYVGYTPLDIKFGRFGYTRVYKDQNHNKQYGTRGIVRVNASGLEY